MGSWIMPSKKDPRFIVDGKGHATDHEEERRRFEDKRRWSETMFDLQRKKADLTEKLEQEASRKFVNGNSIDILTKIFALIGSILGLIFSGRSAKRHPLPLSPTVPRNLKLGGYCLLKALFVQP